MCPLPHEMELFFAPLEPTSQKRHNTSYCITIPVINIRLMGSHSCRYSCTGIIFYFIYSSCYVEAIGWSLVHVSSSSRINLPHLMVILVNIGWQTKFVTNLSSDPNLNLIKVSGPKRHVFRRDWITCLQFVEYTRFPFQYKKGDLNDHFSKNKFFTFDNK